MPSTRPAKNNPQNYELMKFSGMTCPCYSVLVKKSPNNGAPADEQGNPSVLLGKHHYTLLGQVAEARHFANPEKYRERMRSIDDPQKPGEKHHYLLMDKEKAGSHLKFLLKNGFDEKRAYEDRSVNVLDF